MKIISILAMLLTGIAATLCAEVSLSTYEYKIDDKPYEGFLALPADDGKKHPGVLIAHDWMGCGEFSKEKAKYLAGIGYVALAVDMYGKGIRAKDSDEAAKLAGEFYNDYALFRARIVPALDELKKQPQVDPKRLGAIGFCFGGSTVLELARSGTDVAGVVSFHGLLKSRSPEDAKGIRCKVLVLHGNLDPMVPPAQVAAFMDEMNAAKAWHKFVGYPNAVHAFTNPAAGSDMSKPVAYNPEVAKASFEEMERFFKSLFGG
jgi:dienelactone hydrolase